MSKVKCYCQACKKFHQAEVPLEDRKTAVIGGAGKGKLYQLANCSDCKPVKIKQ